MTYKPLPETEEELDALSDDEVMNRVNAARDIMHQVDAAAYYLNHTNAGADLEMYAFLSIFFPDMPHLEKRALANDAERESIRRYTR